MPLSIKEAAAHVKQFRQFCKNALQTTKSSVPYLQVRKQKTNGEFEMNAQEMREMIVAIYPDLNLEGCYPEIMPRVTAQQLGKLLDVAEQGGNAETWSWLAAQFLKYGQQDVIAANIDRLALFVAELGSAAWVLVEVPHLPNEYRDRLIPLVKERHDAAWGLREVPNLSDKHRAHLEKVAG